MSFQDLILVIVGGGLLSVGIGGCASSAPTPPATPTTLISGISSQPPSEVQKPPVAKGSDNYLICRAKKNRFHYDWDANSFLAGQNKQNSIRFIFRPAKRPAGSRGENLKVGECGWARALPEKSKKFKSQVIFNSLSDEATQNFYTLKTGKVFKVPVRPTKNGLVAAPGAGVSVIR